MNADDLTTLREQALAEARDGADAAALEAVRVKYLGRKGLLPGIMTGIKDADPRERPLLGKKANELKRDLQAALQEAAERLASGSAPVEDPFDATLPGRWRGLGSEHPVTQIIDRSVAIFRTMGFTVAEGPDVETVHYNFDALNTPADHPSREATDTFYLENGMLLRCHTSPVQVRFMEQHRPPIRIVAPGRCYRRDTPDATHTANFHQIEGLYVAENVSLSDLKGDLTYFAQQLMGPSVKVRFRPHFFPFTEPSVEVDFSCHVCGGGGCRVCKQSGWIEIAGAGMVDPNVLQAVRYDPEAVTGYAFGMGIERMAAILYGVPDIRMLYENDIRFLRQF